MHRIEIPQINVKDLSKSRPRFSRVTQALLGLIGFVAIVGALTTPYMAAATLAYGLMSIGLLNRKTTIVHARLMGSAIALDLGIVVTLELQRHAINTALSFSLTPMQQAHIAMSSIATLLYFPVVFLGWKRFRGKLSASGMRWHIRLGISAYAFRTLGFILMFALLEQKIH